MASIQKSLHFQSSKSWSLCGILLQASCFSVPQLNWTTMPPPPPLANVCIFPPDSHIGVQLLYSPLKPIRRWRLLGREVSNFCGSQLGAVTHFLYRGGKAQNRTAIPCRVELETVPELQTELPFGRLMMETSSRCVWLLNQRITR